MSAVKFRCSSIGRLMTEPLQIAARFRTPEVEEIIAKKKRTDEEKALIALLKTQTLSAGAKTYVRELVAQEVYGVDFEFSSRETEKGIECEPLSIALLNSVRGLALVKNTERRSNGFITGECDLYDAPRQHGHDVKTSWSVKTFPITEADCIDSIYEWQCRGYLWLWDAQQWSVDYCLVNTPDHLIGYEPQSLHFVDHIPPAQRVTTWTIRRDAEKEELMAEKVKAARMYFAEVVAEFDRTHALELEAA